MQKIKKKGRWYLGTTKRVQMVFTRKNGPYVGTDIVRYPFKIIQHELRIKCRFMI